MQHVRTYRGAVLGQLRLALAAQHRRGRGGTDPSVSGYPCGGLSGDHSLNPDSLGEIRGSDKHIWRLGGKSRRVPDGAKIHCSVLQRMAGSENNHRPCNLPTSYVTVD